MNFIKRGLLVMACSIGTGLSQSSLAAEATAAIDWSQLQISVTGIGGVVPTVTFSDQHTTLNASASVPGQISENNSTSVYNWTLAADTHADAGATHANTLVSPLSFSGSAQASESLGTYPGLGNPREVRLRGVGPKLFISMGLAC